MKKDINKSIIYTFSEKTSPTPSNTTKTDSVNINIYQGSHLNKLNKNFDLHYILPGCTYAEKKARYINIEGTINNTNEAFKPLKHSRNDWHILKALGEVIDIKSDINSYSDFKSYFNKFGINNKLKSSIFLELPESNLYIKSLISLEINKYLMSDPLSKLSKVLAKNSSNTQDNFGWTHVQTIVNNNHQI